MTMFGITRRMRKIRMIDENLKEMFPYYDDRAFLAEGSGAERIRILEIAGIPGAGKSFLKTRMMKASRAYGNVLDLESALRESWFLEWPLMRWFQYFGIEGLLTRYLRSIRSRPQRRMKEIARSIQRSPDFWKIISDVCSEGECCEPAEGIFSVFSLITNLGLARRSIKKSDILILDEGFYHKSLSLFGFSTSLDHPRVIVDQYLRAVPHPRSLIVVETPVDQCIRRLNTRGWPSRFQRLDNLERKRVMTQQREILRDVTVVARDLGVNVNVVQGSDDLAFQKCMTTLQEIGIDNGVWRSVRGKRGE